MTDRKVFWIRIFIAMVTFIVFSRTIISFLKKEFGAGNWFPNLIETVLFMITVITLANGVSYLSEIYKKCKNKLKVLTGILSLMILIITFFPQDQDASTLIGWTTFIGLSSSSILISLFSVLEWAQIKKGLRWLFPFLFALFSGVCSCVTLSFIFRGYNHSESGLLFIGYGAIIFLVSMIVNFIAVSSLKISLRGNQ